jgi:hypothetical protein
MAFFWHPFFWHLDKWRLIPLRNAVQNLLSLCFSVEYSAKYQSFTVAQFFYLFCGCAKLTEKDSKPQTKGKTKDKI